LQAQVDKFVEQQVVQAAQQPASKRTRGDNEGEGKSQGVKVAKITSAAVAADGEVEGKCGGVKVAKNSASAVAPLDISLSEDGLLRCRVREFKGKLYADLRKFYSVRL
jgi:hypothetical protein